MELGDLGVDLLATAGVLIENAWDSRAMSSRLSHCFAELRARGRRGFVAFVTAGDPGLRATREIALALAEAGVDILELGIPFSDPLADGPTIQAATTRALAAGTTTRGVLDLVAAIRLESSIPIVLFTYLNPVFTYGYERFCRDAVTAGADGLLLLDLPPDEAGANSDLTGSFGLDAVCLIAPTTPPQRMERIVRAGSGFVYYVSREGVTGEQPSISGSIGAQVGEIRRHTSLPIAVGFGISTPDQAADVARCGDAVVVGSAIVRRIAENPSDPARAAADFVRPLVAAVKSV